MDKTPGEKVKELRLAKGLTLNDVSGLTGLSVSHLSQFERGQVSLSMASFELLAEALDTPISYVLDTARQRDAYFMRSYDFKPVGAYLSGGTENYLGNGSGGAALAPILVTLAPGETTEFKADGGEGFVYALEGILTVNAGDETHTLNPSDSIHSPAGYIKSCENRSTRMVRFIFVKTV